MVRMISVFTRPPAKPATMPMAVPSTKAQSTGVMPMKRDKRAPMISRVSMSRPSSSLPSGKPAVPIGLSRWSIDDWYGSAGASHGPNSASSNSSNTTLAAPTATGPRRGRRRSRTVAQGPRWRGAGKAGAAPAVAGRVGMVCMMGMAWRRAASGTRDARVEQRLQHIDQQIEHDEEQRQHQDRSLQQRQVALEDGAVEQQAGAWPREHRLDQDRAAQQVTQLQAEHRQRRGRRVLYHVAQHTGVRKPLGAQADDEFLLQNVGHQRTHGARDDAHRNHRHRERRQQQELQ